MSLQISRYEAATRLRLPRLPTSPDRRVCRAKIGNLDAPEFNEALHQIKEVISKHDSSWETFVLEKASQRGSIDPNVLVQWILRESYVQTTEDLRRYAEKVKDSTTLKERREKEVLELVCMFSKDLESMCKTGVVDVPVIMRRLSSLIAALAELGH